MYEELDEEEGRVRKHQLENYMDAGKLVRGKDKQELPKLVLLVDTIYKLMLNYEGAEREGEGETNISASWAQDRLIGSELAFHGCISPKAFDVSGEDQNPYLDLSFTKK